MEPAAVHLELTSRPECISLVRGMLAGVAEGLELDRELLDDLKTAVSEAFNNVVLHAYEDGPGPLAVMLTLRADAIEAIVRDWGAGIQQVAPAEDRIHVGLALISALADRAEFVSTPEGGTEVRIAFNRGVQSSEPPRGLAAAPASDDWRSRLYGDVIVTLSPIGLLSGVLGRLARALAASAASRSTASPTST